MRIGVLARHIDELGGIAVYTRELLTQLFRVDSTNLYFVFYADPRSVGTFASYPNVSEICIESRSRLFWDQWHVARHAGRLGLDVVFGPKMAIPVGFRGFKVVTIHGAEQFLFPREFSIGDRLYVRIALGIFARIADRVVVPSRTSRDDLSRTLRIPRHKLVAIHHGPKDVYGRQRMQAEIDGVRAKYRLPEEFLLHVGLVWGAKNFAVLPKVLEILNESRSLPLVHAGKPHRWNEARATRSPLIRELGFVPDEDLAALYASASALVFPSLYEGFGIPLLEAMAARCPVVTTQWGAMKEVCGDAALLVDPTNPEEIAGAVETLLRDDVLRETLIRRGLERAQDFSWANAAAKTLDVFREITGDSEHRGLPKPASSRPLPAERAPAPLSRGSGAGSVGRSRRRAGRATP